MDVFDLPGTATVTSDPAGQAVRADAVLPVIGPVLVAGDAPEAAAEVVG